MSLTTELSSLPSVLAGLAQYYCHDIDTVEFYNEFNFKRTLPRLGSYISEHWQLSACDKSQSLDSAHPLEENDKLELKEIIVKFFTEGHKVLNDPNLCRPLTAYYSINDTRSHLLESTRLTSNDTDGIRDIILLANENELKLKLVASLCEVPQVIITALWNDRDDDEDFNTKIIHQLIKIPQFCLADFMWFYPDVRGELESIAEKIVMKRAATSTPAAVGASGTAPRMTKKEVLKLFAKYTTDNDENVLLKSRRSLEDRMVEQGIDFEQLESIDLIDFPELYLNELAGSLTTNAQSKIKVIMDIKDGDWASIKEKGTTRAQSLELLKVLQRYNPVDSALAFFALISSSTDSRTSAKWAKELFKMKSTTLETKQSVQAYKIIKPESVLLASVRLNPEDTVRRTELFWAFRQITSLMSANNVDFSEAGRMFNLPADEVSIHIRFKKDRDTQLEGYEHFVRACIMEGSFYPMKLARLLPSYAIEDLKRIVENLNDAQNKMQRPQSLSTFFSRHHYGSRTESQKEEFIKKAFMAEGVTFEELEKYRTAHIPEAFYYKLSPDVGNWTHAAQVFDIGDLTILGINADPSIDFGEKTIKVLKLASDDMNLLEFFADYALITCAGKSAQMARELFADKKFQSVISQLS